MPMNEFIVEMVMLQTLTNLVNYESVVIFTSTYVHDNAKMLILSVCKIVIIHYQKFVKMSKIKVIMNKLSVHKMQYVHFFACVIQIKLDVFSHL
jgi:hypothetical protein